VDYFYLLGSHTREVVYWLLLLVLHPFPDAEGGFL
jgi:hypothetical protein